MRPKPTPTSPKTRADADRAIEELYTSLPTFAQPTRSLSGWAVVGLAVIVTLVVSLGTPVALNALHDRYPQLGWLDTFSFQRDQQPVVIRETAPVQESSVTANLLDRLAPSLVVVYQAHTGKDVLSAAYSPIQALGYGFIGTTDGVIVTTADVVGDRDVDLVVAHADGTVSTVSTVVRDTLTPYVFLLTSGEGLTATPFASRAPGAGATLTLAHPLAPRLGTELITTTTTSPSSLPVRTATDLLESTESFRRLVSISPVAPSGWSGAVAVNEANDVVGLWSEDAGGIVPLDSIVAVLARVRRDRAVTRNTVGLHVVDLSLGLGLSAELRASLPAAGALVTASSDGKIPAVKAESAASSAGLKAGDVITKVNGTALDRTSHLTLLLQREQPGGSVVLTVLRDGEERTMPLNLPNP